MSKNVFIGNRAVGDDNTPYLIGEIGINHNGDIQIAKRLIDAAFSVGWDAVKFQKRVPEIAVPADQKGILRDTPWGRMTYLEYKKRIEFGKEEYDIIESYCKEKPISWSASPWDIPSLDFILNYDIPFIKVASATLTNDELLIKASQSGKPIIMSTGMSTIEEIDHAVEIIEKYSKDNFILMHANSSYPAKLDELNLEMIHTLRERYNCLVGYSGHEDDIEPSVVAVALGACVIERHITIDRNMWGTDQAASITLPGMFALKGRVDVVSGMLGNGRKVLCDAELKVRKKLRG